MCRSAGVVPPSEILPLLDRDRYFDLKEAAEYTGLSVRTLRRLLPSHLKFRVSQRKILVRKSDLDTWLDGFREEPETDLSRIADDAVKAVLGE